MCNVLKRERALPSGNTGFDFFRNKKKKSKRERGRKALAHKVIRFRVYWILAFSIFFCYESVLYRSCCTLALIEFFNIVVYKNKIANSDR